MTRHDNLLINLFREELVFLNVPYTEFSSAVKFAGKKMEQLEYVKASFSASVLEREINLPTGLQLDGYGVVIPHTDGSHIYQSVISVLVFKEPIIVKSMIDPTKSVATKLMFLLAVKEPNGQLEVLKELMKLFKNVQVLKDIEGARDVFQVLELIDNSLESGKKDERL